MAEHKPSRLWVMRSVYLGIALLIPLLHLLPLTVGPRAWAPPDLLFALTYAWAVRRPEYVPALAILLAVLLSDFLLQRPPGLWTAIVLVMIEWTKSRESRQVETTLVLEWMSFGLVVVAAILINRLVLLVSVTSTGAFSLAAIQAGATIGICFFTASSIRCFNP